AIHRSSFSTNVVRLFPAAQAIHLESGDQAKAPPITPSVRNGPPLADTTPMSWRLASSNFPVGLVMKAIERESGDQRTYQRCVPETRRRRLPLASSTTHRFGYWSRSSST